MNVVFYDLANSIYCHIEFSANDYNRGNGERSGSVVECLTQDRGAAGSSLTGVTALWSLSKTHYPSLVLIQPRKTRLCLTERLLMEHKESNKKQSNVY